MLTVACEETAPSFVTVNAAVLRDVAWLSPSTISLRLTASWLRQGLATHATANNPATTLRTGSPWSRETHTGALPDPKEHVQAVTAR